MFNSYKQTWQYLSRARKTSIEIHMSSGQVSLWFPCPTFNSTCPLSKLERTENVQMNYVLNVYLSFGQLNTNSHLSHRQNNLSQTSGYCVFCTLLRHTSSLYKGILSPSMMILRWLLKKNNLSFFSNEVRDCSASGCQE